MIRETKKNDIVNNIFGNNEHDVKTLNIVPGKS